MKLSRNTKIMIAGLVLIYTSGCWLVWEHFIKVSWCQETSTLNSESVRTVVVNFDDTGLDDAEAKQAQSTIQSVINEPKGWRQAGYNFVFDRQPAEVTFHLATADKLASLQQCSAQFSCRVGRNVYINSARWQEGSPSLSIPLSEYRAMVINHELGHALGFNHWRCFGHGVKAPVMQQQSFDLGGLQPNAWPIEEEIKSIIKPSRN